MVSAAGLARVDVEWILGRALGGRSPAERAPEPFTVALLFLTPSLRTRLGFAVAAVRAGGVPVDIGAVRSDPSMSTGESFEDTLAVTTGMADVTVVRARADLGSLDLGAVLRGPLVNGGDSRHHPTQALVDFAAIRRYRGPMHERVVAICGDLGMRSVRSLIELMRDDPPRELVLVPAPGREFADDLGPLASRTTVRGPGDLTGVDVVIMAGVPEGEGAARLGTEVRARHALDLGVLRTLPGDAVVLSPMPVIDEITDKARRDPRVRMLDQSELSVEVRLAVLEWIRRGGPR